MLLEKFKNINIILASGSHRRQELFKELGLDFKIKVKPIEEVYSLNLKQEEITNYLAELKAKVFDIELRENDLVITSDTIVWIHDKALEKPKNELEAARMLQELSGNNHKVITSICLKSKNIQKTSNTIKIYKKHQNLMKHIQNQ